MRWLTRVAVLALVIGAASTAPAYAMTITEYRLPPETYRPSSIAPGGDGALWLGGYGVPSLLTGTRDGAVLFVVQAPPMGLDTGAAAPRSGDRAGGGRRAVEGNDERRPRSRRSHR